MSKLTLTAKVIEGDSMRPICVVGQFARTLLALTAAGPRGVTSLEIATWALRLGHYIFILRSQYGLDIEMVREPHEGPAGRGWHGRYFLRSHVIVNDDGKHQGQAA
jgi:hypothetical protein